MTKNKIYSYSNTKPVTIISLNDTDNPRTGGEYVYQVIKKELIRRGYPVTEYSLPVKLKRYHNLSVRRFLTPLYYLFFILISIWKRYLSRDIVITSTSPGFPLFGDIVYHQPKSSIGTDKKGLTFYEKTAMLIHENEFLSPLWLIAKNTHKIHISNSQFTQKTLKDLYNIDSKVIYPPVEVEKYLEVDLKNQRPYTILVSRPRGITGIGLLRDIIKELPLETKVTIFGDADESGKITIQKIQEQGYKIEYLGWVNEQQKLELFATHAFYLHLSQNEPFGITLIEAMASGCVPIAPKSGGIPEYLPEQYLYATPGDAVKKILENQSTLDNRRMLREIVSRFNREKFSDEIIKLIKA